MRARLILCMLMIVIILTACDNSLSYSESDEDMISEYIANKLLKYNDESYDGWYVGNNDNNNIGNIDENESNELEIEDVKDNSNSLEETGNETISENRPDAINDKEPLALDTLKIKKDLIVKYEKFKLYDIYPEKDETYFSLKPREGHKLLVLDFTIKNEGSKKVKINLTKIKYKYKLAINGETKLKPLLTLLENDLQYLNMDINSDESVDVILIFEVNKDIKVDDIILEVESEKDNNFYRLKK